jgi:uroporphyrinogen decarboxylase
VNDHLLIDAALGKPVPRTPVWIMRQAGRYLPEYQAIRRKMSFLELCHTPEKAAEVSIQPLDILGVDGVIVFSDIMVPLEGMGMDVQFIEGRGPVISDPIRSVSDISRLKAYDPFVQTGFLPDTIRLLVNEVGHRAPVLGFAGAPYTLACYAVEGTTSRYYHETKKFMMSDPEGFKKLLDVLADAVADLLDAQIEAGASLVQLFDTWAGALMPDQFREFALPFAQKIFERIQRPGVPMVYFVNGVAGKLKDIAQSGASVLGIDWRIDLAEVRRIVGPDFVLQGNLDPCTLYAPLEVIEERVKSILSAAGSGPHIFNLGHGILPTVPVSHAQHFVKTVQRLGIN